MADRDYALDEEPIFWTSTRPGFNEPDRTRHRMVNGERVTEKHPQIGHVGDIKNKRRAPGVRFIYMVRHDGNEVAICMTNAAAHLDSSGPWGQYQVMKARFLGWYPTGDCPCALLATGRLRNEHIIATEIIKQDPCAPGTYTRDEPCPHSKLEQKARQVLRAKLEEERFARAKDYGQKMIDATKEQTSELVSMIRDTIAQGQAQQLTPEAIGAIVRGVMAENKGKHQKGGGENG